jgi:hypothetical protein
VPIAIWTIVEVNIAIVCACLVTIKPLIIKLLPKLLLDRNARDGYQPQASSDERPVRQLTVGSKPLRVLPVNSTLRSEPDLTESKDMEANAAVSSDESVNRQDFKQDEIISIPSKVVLYK